jgi:putative Ca2+/H+ antiporter (TMEM165/GDT1 family)
VTDFTLASFGAVAATLFVAELTDKDAFLLIAESTRLRARIVFSAGAVAFVFTTTVLVTTGSLLVAFVPVYWIRAAGGVVMIAYGLWSARGLIGVGAVKEEESRIEKAATAWKSFIALVAALALLDLAGDATEVLTIVFVARYQNPVLVFAGACAGLVSATAVETALGNRLGNLLTPRRLRVGSAIVFLTLGILILLFNSS